VRLASLISALPDFGFAPHRVIAFGFLYLALTGWSELYDHAWLHAESFGGR